MSGMGERIDRSETGNGSESPSATWRVAMQRSAPCFSVEEEQRPGHGRGKLRDAAHQLVAVLDGWERGGGQLRDRAMREVLVVPISF